MNTIKRKDDKVGKIVIVLEGGLVQTVLSDQPTEIVIVDYDVDCSDTSDITTVLGNDATLQREMAEVNLAHIDEIFNNKLFKGDNEIK